MPDDMLEDAIQISKKTLDEHDFETEGVEVRNRFQDVLKEEIHISDVGCLTSYTIINLKLNFRSQERSRNIWMTSGSHTGMYSWASLSVATLYMREIVLCTLHSSLAKSLSSSTRHLEQVNQREVKTRNLKESDYI